MTNPPQWLQDAIFYQVFPERFANGDPSLDPDGVAVWGGEPTRDNFFGGDLAGMTAHLDHIEQLGANAIYLTPIFEADTNHRYDAKDYFHVDHRLGDLNSFRTFLDAAHERGIRVVLDAVLNHCGDGHWAFRDVVDKEEASEYVNWYYFEGFPVEPHPVPNYRTCSGCYYLPKWNVHNPEVRKHHYDVARYWVEQGIDGWRLDVPYFINRNFWRGFHATVKGIDDQLYIVAEEWRDPEEWLQDDLADGTMNYTLRDLILGFTADGTITAGQFVEGMDRLRDRIPEASRPAMLNLLGSHDTERVVTRHTQRLGLVTLAYTLLFVAQGAPMIYYGDEIGLEGANDPACRGTMPWNTAEWNHELLDNIRALTRLRSSTPPLRSGDQHAQALGADAVALLRSTVGGAVLALVNRGESPLSIPAGMLDGTAWGHRWDTAWTAAAAFGKSHGTVTEIPAQSALILVRGAEL